MEAHTEPVGIPTEYKGVKLKSRMEAQCAFLFDQLGWQWEYEPRSLMLSTGVTYIPDFSVCAGRLTVECRGYNSPRGDRQLKDFIADPARGDFLVMGPTRCSFYHRGSIVPDEASVTFCPLCLPVWYFRDNTLDRVENPECMSCGGPTFSSLGLRVNRGIFAVQLGAYEYTAEHIGACAPVFDQKTALRVWRDSVKRGLLNDLGRPDLACYVLRNNLPPSPDGAIAKAALDSLFSLLRPWQVTE